MRIDLVPFSSCSGVESLSFSLSPESSSGLRLTVQLQGLIASDLEVANQVGRREFGLWQHHCFELFIAEAGSTAYWELNIAPNGNWNCFEFDDYRLHQRESDRCVLSAFRAARRGRIFELDAKILTNPRFQASGAALSLGVAAILKTASGLNYFSIRHGATPDFHDTNHHIPWTLQ